MPQDVNLTIGDGALGAVPFASDNIAVVLGCTSAGTANLPVQTSSIKALQTSFGNGIGIEAAAYMIQASGNPVIFCKVPTTVAGTNTAVAFVGTGTSVITLTGTPVDDYQGVFTTVVGGTRGVTGIIFTYSLDGGRTVSAQVSLGTATTFVIPNTGLTLNFAAGTFVAGDVATWGSTSQNWSVADISTALTTILALTFDFSLIHIVGVAGASDVTAIDGYLTSAQNGFRYVRAICSARDNNVGETEAQWITALQTAWTSVSSLRVGVGAGMMNINSPISGRYYRRNVAWAAAARAVSKPVQVDLGRVKDGALKSAIFKSDATPADVAIYHDERVTQGLDSTRLITARTHIGKPGLYIKNPNLLAPNGSDFTLLQYGRVMDVACRTVRATLLEELNNDVRLDPKTGFILEKDAQAIESRLRNALQVAVVTPAAASAATAVLSRTDNLSSSRTLNATVRVLPKGYLKDIEVDIAFVNPLIA